MKSCKAAVGEAIRSNSATLWVVLLLLACFAAHLRVEAAPPTTVSSNRFLFVVDTSAGMKKLDDAIRQSVFDLIFSGARGRMTNGDTFGVWFVNEANDTSYPMQVWKKKFAVEMAAHVALQIKERGFKGSAKLDVALQDVAHVVRSVGDVNVIIVSDGSTRISGTPFDQEINATFAALQPVMRQAKASVNTVLVAQDGKYVGWAANSPDFLINFPQVPDRVRARPAQHSTAPIATATARPPASGPASAPVTPQARPNAKPIIITRETVEFDRSVTRAMATTHLSDLGGSNHSDKLIIVNQPTGTATNGGVASASSAPSRPAPASQNEATPADGVTGIATGELPVMTTTGGISAPESFSSAPGSQESKVTPAQEKRDSIYLPTQSPAQPRSATNWKPGIIGFLAALGLAGFGWFTLFLLRERRNEPSLITRAAAMERLRH